MSPLVVTVGRRPDLDLLVAAAADRRSAQLLEQAGFVRDDALDLHRPRRDTAASIAERQLQDASRLLTAAGYGVTRVYSETEQRARMQNRPSWVEDGPLQTTGRTARSDRVTADVCNGHLVLLASHDSPYESRELLGRYAASGEGAIFYTEAAGGEPFYGIGRYADLDAALAAWTASGYSAEVPAVGPRRAAALSSSPSRPARTASVAPASAAPVPPPAARVLPPWPTTGRASPPF
ncbi:hypothetical protein ACFWA9_07260 [Kitasatospora sp. NPDC059973]|uniref:hypothetical protein n=1 Tax=Kitasatospora sp. NPDC059973 TaxID=3347020 RepID=UPI00367F65E7